MADWKTAAHLEDHYGLHRREIGSRSVVEYNASAQQTIGTGTRFAYTDRRTNLRRIGYHRRDTSRFVGCDLDGLIVTHYILDEGDVFDLWNSTYTDECGTMLMMEMTERAPAQSQTTDPTETLHEVYRRLVSIHASVAESVQSHPGVIPWVARELRDLKRYISASGGAPPRPTTRPTYDDEIVLPRHAQRGPTHDRAGASCWQGGCVPHLGSRARSARCSVSDGDGGPIQGACGSVSKPASFQPAMPPSR